MAKKIKIDALDFINAGSRATEADWLLNGRSWQEKGVSPEIHAKISANILGLATQILYGDDALTKDEIMDLAAEVISQGVRS